MERPLASDRNFSLEELQQLSGVARRTIRYYIELGLVDGPIGETRAAYYTWRHLQRLLAIRRLTEEGFSLDRVRQRLESPDPSAPTSATGSIEVRSHLRLAEGIEFVIDPVAAQLDPEQLRRFLGATLEALAQVRGETTR